MLPPTIRNKASMFIFTTVTQHIASSFTKARKIKGMGFPRWLRWSRICPQRGRPRFDAWVRKTPWRRKWQPTPAFFAWRIPWTEELGGLQSSGVTKMHFMFSDCFGVFFLKIFFFVILYKKLKSYCTQEYSFRVILPDSMIIFVLMNPKYLFPVP